MREELGCAECCLVEPLRSTPVPSSMKPVAGKVDVPELMDESRGEDKNEPSAVASAVSASGVSHEAAAAGDEAPYPWFTPDTPLPVLCYFPMCLAEYHSMGDMLKHVQLRHEVKMKDIKESYLASQGTKELSELQKKKRAEDRRTGKTPKKKPKQTMGAIDKRSECLHEASPQEVPTAVASAAAAPPPDQSHTNSEWQARICYVRAAKGGDVLRPLEVFGLAGYGEPVPPGCESRGC